MSYPTPAAYQEALQFPETAFLDPELQGCQPETNVLGLPRAITGAYATVFPVTVRSGHRYAVKCFTVPPRELGSRYRVLSRYLTEKKLPCMVEFEYVRRGIRVGDGVYPLLKMEWIEGVPLNRFVEQHLQDSDMLREVGSRFRELVHTLEAAGVAHGDLQHGNILVQMQEETPILRLVDYDAMYIPDFQGKKAREVGHRNYQHPDRDAATFGPEIDRFAALVIYTALQALQLQPELWQTYDTGENMLFQAADFYHPGESELFRVLYEMEPLQPLVYALQRACYQEPQAVPSLEEVLGEGHVTVAVRRLPRRRRRTQKKGHRRVPLWLPGLMLPVAGGVLLNPWVGGGVAVLEGLALLGRAWMGYPHVPAVQRRRRLESELAYISSVIARLQQDIERLEQEKARVQENQETFRAERLRELQERVLKNRLRHHFIQEIEQVEGLSHKTVIRLKSAGIRNAYQATEERLARVRSLPPEQRTRILLWRNALIARYREDIPQQLSPAEERQVRRLIAYRLEEIDREIKRLRERQEVQRKEEGALREQLRRLPSIRFTEYVLALLGIKALPRLENVPAPPVRKVHAGLPDVQASEEQPWWKQG